MKKLIFNLVLFSFFMALQNGYSQKVLTADNRSEWEKSETVSPRYRDMYYGKKIVFIWMVCGN
jgi:hypothetical protein